MKATPLVSIIIPTFNRAQLIAETLDSVLAQTYQNWECIIVDDGSSDNTDEVVGQYVEKDSRFNYYHRPDEHLPGGNGARNYGFKMSEGEYVNWLDSDDLFAKDKIEKQIQTLLGNSESISTCAWGRFSDKSNFTLKKLQIFKDYTNASDIFSNYGHKGFFPNMVFLCHRSIFNKSGLWNENLIINQDGEFFCRVILNSKSIYFTKDTYVLYRQDSSTKTSYLSSIEKAKASIQSWEIIQDHLNKKNVKSQLYIANAKNYIYNKLEFTYPDLINKNKLFFKNQIKNNSIKGRLTRKINNLLK